MTSSEGVLVEDPQFIERPAQMCATLVLVLVLGLLAVLALIIFRSSLEGGIHNDLAAPTPDSFVDGTTLYKQWPQPGSVPINCMESLIGCGKCQLNNYLEARQLEVRAWLQSVQALLPVCTLYSSSEDSA